MKRIHAVLALAAAAFAAAPVLAQSSSCSIDSSNLQTTCTDTAILGAGPVITTNESSSVFVTPSSSYVAVAPAADIAYLPLVPGNRILPGATIVQGPTTVMASGPTVLVTPSVTETTVLGAGPAMTSSQTVVSSAWINMPAGAENRADVQRWMRLKP